MLQEKPFLPTIGSSKSFSPSTKFSTTACALPGINLGLPTLKRIKDNEEYRNDPSSQN